MKEQAAGASKFILKGKEFFVRHNFTFGEDVTNIFETTSGAFIHPNGEPVKDRYLLEQLPEQHRGRAFAWWDQTFGVAGQEVKTLADVKEEPAVREMTKKEIIAEVRSMQARIEMLTSMAAEMEDEPPKTAESVRKEAEDVTSKAAEDIKEPERSKDAKGRFVAKGDKAKERSIIAEMGING